MLTRIRHIGRDERGMSLIFVTFGLTAFVAASTIAIDLGMLLNARAQAQNSADAGALAGATALAFNDFNDRSASGPAVQGAINAALANKVAGYPVTVGAGDVTFPTAPSGATDRVQVNVFRTGTNAVATMIASMFGVNAVDISAQATAEAILANADTCVKPWAIPDKWIERQTPSWDLTDTFTAFPTNPSVFPDIYRDVTLSTYSGYTRTMVGTEIKLTFEVSNIIRPDMYFPVRLPGDNGQIDFINNISACHDYEMRIGDALNVESAASETDTATGVTNLIARDPGAYWNSATQTVISSQNPSPRIVVVPLYDPLYFDQGKKVGNFTQLRITNFIGFFVDHLEGNLVVGRVMPVLGQMASNGTAAPVGAYARAIRLVESPDVAERGPCRGSRRVGLAGRAAHDRHGPVVHVHSVRVPAGPVRDVGHGAAGRVQHPGRRGVRA
jgi:hypothetical protein